MRHKDIILCVLGYFSPSNKLSFRLGVEDISSGHHEALDNAYKCDSDIEDNETSESLDVGKSVQARR